MAQHMSPYLGSGLAQILPIRQLRDNLVALCLNYIRSVLHVLSRLRILQCFLRRLGKIAPIPLMWLHRRFAHEGAPTALTSSWPEARISARCAVRTEVL